MRVLLVGEAPSRGERRNSAVAFTPGLTSRSTWPRRLPRCLDPRDVRFEADLVAAHDPLAQSSALNDAGSVQEEWLAAHAAFHHAMPSGFSNLRLRAMANQLRDATEVYRFRQGGAAGRRAGPGVAGGHRRIPEAILAREADHAVAEPAHRIEFGGPQGS
ncbi:FCD domain-containing protein [Streptomyces sp. NPDC059909]|uniref:FCD domain-containing protein n=1 Tax=Streptomyces sp. NPDC059909 TaxID=3346998 RepID=UPI00364D4E37